MSESGIEIDKARAQCGQPKPLRQRLLLVGLYWMVALLWTFSAFARHRPYHGIFGSVWVVPAMWWFMAILWTWQAFRPRASSCAIDSGAPPSIRPSAN